MQSIADFASRYIEGPAYEWGSAEAGPVAGFRRAFEGGGSIEEITARVLAWARRTSEPLSRRLGMAGSPIWR